MHSIKKPVCVPPNPRKHRGLKKCPNVPPVKDADTYAHLKDNLHQLWDRRGRYHMVVGFTITYAIGVYHH